MTSREFTVRRVSIVSSRPFDDVGNASIMPLVDQRADDVHVSCDTMASVLSPYGDREAVELATVLDAKVEALLGQVAGSSNKS